MIRSVARRAAGKIRRAVRGALGHGPAENSAWHVVPVELRPWTDEAFISRRLLDCRPEVLLDVGANDGMSVRRFRKGGYAGRAISFEPQRAPFEALRRAAASDPAWDCFHLALGDKAGTLPMHVSAFSQSSSLFPIGDLHVELMPATREVAVEEVSIVRLDQWEGAPGLLGKRLFLKLDVQGYELPAIRGMGELLSFTQGALVEMNFSPMFDGQSKYFEVMAALEAAGLHFVGLTGLLARPNTSDILWADGFFVRG